MCWPTTVRKFQICNAANRSRRFEQTHSKNEIFADRRAKLVGSSAKKECGRQTSRERERQEPQGSRAASYGDIEEDLDWAFRRQEFQSTKPRDDHDRHRRQDEPSLRKRRHHESVLSVMGRAGHRIGAACLTLVGSDRLESRLGSRGNRRGHRIMWPISD